MSFYGLLAFCAAYVLAVASPGPGVAAVVARSLVHGTRGARAFIAGFLVGDLMWFGLAALGLTALAQTAQPLFLLIKYAGAAYLLFLAYRLWTQPAQRVDVDNVKSGKTKAHLFVGSLALTLGNPKTMLFFLALLPTVVDLNALTIEGFVKVAVAISVLLPLILGAYALAAARARRFFHDPRALRVVNRGTGAVMAGAAVTVATR